jgi:hypothetical protein
MNKIIIFIEIFVIDCDTNENINQNSEGTQFPFWCNSEVEWKKIGLHLDITSSLGCDDTFRISETAEFASARENASSRIRSFHDENTTPQLDETSERNARRAPPTATEPIFFTSKVLYIYQHSIHVHVKT